VVGSRRNGNEIKNPEEKREKGHRFGLQREECKCLFSLPPNSERSGRARRNRQVNHYLGIKGGQAVLKKMKRKSEKEGRPEHRTPLRLLDPA